MLPIQACLHLNQRDPRSQGQFHFIRNENVLTQQVLAVVVRFTNKALRPVPIHNSLTKL